MPKTERKTPNGGGKGSENALLKTDAGACGPGPRFPLPLLFFLFFLLLSSHNASPNARHRLPNHRISSNGPRIRIQREKLALRGLRRKPSPIASPNARHRLPNHRISSNGQTDLEFGFSGKIWPYAGYGARFWKWELRFTMRGKRPILRFCAP